MLDLRTWPARRVAVAAFVSYLLVLVSVAFLPLPGPVPPGAGDHVGYNVVLSRPDLLGGWEAERNVLMTVPFGMLLPLVVRWRYELLVLACLAVTLVVETGQLLVSLLVGWAWRAFDVNDLLNNTVGGLLGLAATGAVLLLIRGPGRLPLRRWVAGALAVALVGWAALSTATTPLYAPPPDACAQPPVGAVTQLPGGVSAYAGGDGSLCLRTPDGSEGSVPGTTEPGLVSTLEGAGGDVLEVGVARRGTARATDGRGALVRTYPVQGSDLVVWTASAP